MCSLSLHSCLRILMLLYYNMFCTGMNCKIYVKAETSTDVLLSEKKAKKKKCFLTTVNDPISLLVHAS